MITIGIVGASGYTGVELARLLCNCPDVKLSVATSRQYNARSWRMSTRIWRAWLILFVKTWTTEELAGRADLFFTAVPHQTAMAIVPDLLQAGKKVVDLSADFQAA